MHTISSSDPNRRGYHSCSVNITITPSPFQNQAFPQDPSFPPPLHRPFPVLLRFLYKQPSQTRSDGVSAPLPDNTLRQILFSRHITATTPFSPPAPPENLHFGSSSTGNRRVFSLSPRTAPVYPPDPPTISVDPHRGLVHNLQESETHRDTRDLLKPPIHRLFIPPGGWATPLLSHLPHFALKGYSAQNLFTSSNLKNTHGGRLFF